MAPEWHEQLARIAAVRFYDMTDIGGGGRSLATFLSNV